MEIADIRDQIDIFNTELIGANFDLIAAQADLTRTDQRIANLKQAVQEHEEELSGQRVVFKVTDPVSGIPMEVTEGELENVKLVFEMFVAFVAAAVSYAAIPGLAQAAWNTLKEGDLIEGQKGTEGREKIQSFIGGIRDVAKQTKDFLDKEKALQEIDNTTLDEQSKQFRILKRTRIFA